MSKALWSRRRQAGWGGLWPAALTFHVNLLEARRGYLPAGWDILWSLSVEETFYLFFPLVCRIFRRTNFLSALLFVFVLLGPFARSDALNPNPVWREYSYLGGMDAIALGCLTALFCCEGSSFRAELRVAAGGGTMMLVFVLCFSNLVLIVGGLAGVDWI